jgi:hypothetical protein
MQFIVNLFGTVHATKDVGKQASGLHVLDEKLRVLSNHVDFLLQQHFSRPQQCCELKTYEVYTSENDGQGEDREGGERTPSATDGAEEDGGRPDTDLPPGDSQENRPVAGEAGTGSGEAPATEGRPDAQNSH